MSIQHLLQDIPKPWLDIIVDSIKFNNTSGSAQSQLDYYEEFVGDAVYSQAFSNTVVDGLQLTRIGNIVTVSLSQNMQVVTSNNVIQIGTIPARFRPTDPVNVYRSLIHIWIDDGSPTYVLGSASTDNNGIITLHSDIDFGAFTMGNTVGINALVSFSYPIL